MCSVHLRFAKTRMSDIVLSNQLDVLWLSWLLLPCCCSYHQPLFLLPLDYQVPSSSSPPSLAPAIMADALKSSTLLLDQHPLSTSGAAATTAESLLPIVSSQRERFKQRNAELEAVSCPVLTSLHTPVYVVVYSSTYCVCSFINTVVFRLLVP